MDLLDRLPPTHRERLLHAAVVFRLGRGELLMRRGEQGGDLYRVIEGSFEIIDSRTDPPVVLDLIGPGAVVGEMAFLDQAMRSADVRAAEEAVCQHWARDRLIAILESEPELGMSFYRALADLVNERSRGFRTLALADALGGGSARRAGGFSPDATLQEAQDRMLEALRSHLMAAEPVARADRSQAHAMVMDALTTFEASLQGLLRRMNAEQRRDALVRIGREVHPYLVRSQLGELAMDRPSGRSEDPEAMVHLIRGEPKGDGALGEFIDEWLLDLPTAEALRSRVSVVRRLVRAEPAVPRTLIVNGVRSGLAAGLLPLQAGQTLTVLEDDRAIMDLPSGSGVQLRRDDLAAVALGEATLRLPRHDLLILEGLLDYLPDRPAAVLLSALHASCEPGGRLLLTGLRRSSDAVIFHSLLRWPMVRRSRQALEGLVVRAGFTDARVHVAGEAGAVIEAHVSARTPLAPDPPTAPLDHLA